MKNRFWLLVAWVSIFALSAQAQVSVGASLGANYSFWDWHVKNHNTDVTFNPGFGYRAAAVGDWHISPIIGLRADLAYQIWRNSTALAMIGLDGKRVPFKEGTRSERFHSFAGSLMLQVSPFRQKRLYFLAGATAAHITDARGTVTYEDNGAAFGYNSTQLIDLKNYNRTQVFADFGGGVKFPLGTKGSLFGEFRYQLPLTNLSESDNVDASVSPLLLNVGYLFQF